MEVSDSVAILKAPPVLQRYHVFWQSQVIALESARDARVPELTQMLCRSPCRCAKKKVPNGMCTGEPRVESVETVACDNFSVYCSAMALRGKL